MTQERRENLLMETAMRIQEIFDDMCYAQQVNPDKVDAISSLERLQLFTDWAREFEEKYRWTDRYEDDFIGLSDEFAQRKIRKEFGKTDIIQFSVDVEEGFNEDNIKSAIESAGIPVFGISFAQRWEGNEYESI